MGAAPDVTSYCRGPPCDRTQMSQATVRQGLIRQGHSSLRQRIQSNRGETDLTQFNYIPMISSKAFHQF